VKDEKRLTNWFEHNIEEKVRKYVKALRDNGINTTASCHHEGYIECEASDPTHELEVIYTVLVESGIERYNVEIYAEYTPKYYHKYLRILSPEFTITEEEKQICDYTSDVEIITLKDM
jgi:hypothetical protein